ncbi:unnamed protein product [Trichobilharzia regenti]|uniref:Rho-GAP domain-containing protein n=1 Tax=Trichobilharzia regenti TaxID=157069 RepID=A0A183VZV7_TRIRE|nr:unnamed protein product [Trichobilharzia regenti]VDQ01893.1 unnamed protein product [Trichobilharzia regenti]
MTTPDDIRSRMLHRASRLISGIRNEEAWHLIGLFQQTHPNTFLQICHHTLASFLELTHDYFDQGWPLMTRLMISNHKRAEHRRGRLRSHAAAISSTSKINVHEVFESPIGSPLFLSNTTDRLTTCPSLILSNSKSSDDQSKKMKIKTGSKRILNQLLPSMFPLPTNDSNNNTATKSARFDVTPTKQSSRSHSKTKSFFKHVQPLFSKSITPSETVNRHCTYPPVMLRSHLSQYNWDLPMTTNWINDYSAYCTRYCNVDSKICATLIDYMITNSKLCLTEGVFRIPGNSLRIRELWLKLHQHFQSPYLRVPQPEPDSADENLSPYPVINQYEINQILESYSPHDISSLILRCLTTCTEFQRIHQVINFDTVDTVSTSASYDTSSDYHECSFNDGEYQQTGGLIPLEAGNLLFLATELQYQLKINEPNQSQPDTVSYDDWVYILCHSRQLLAYRIVLQLLLPTPERFLLMNLLRLFKVIDESSSISKMTAECLSRCTAFAVFGAPLKVKRFTSNKEKAGCNFESYTNSLTKRIDTLTNLIRMVHQLEDLPMLIYNAVRNRLRTHLGNSPIPRTTSHNNNNNNQSNTFASSIDRCCEDTLCCSMNCSLTSRREFMNTAHLIPCESITQICSKNQYHSLGSIKTDHSKTGKENFSRKDPNRVHIPRTKSTIDINKSTPIHHQKDCQKTSLLQTTLTVNNTNPTKLDPFQLWKRQKSGQEIRSAYINSSSNVFITKCGCSRGGDDHDDENDNLPTSRVLIKSRSSSFLQESQGFNTQTWLRK